MVQISDFPTSVQTEIKLKGLSGSPHGLASVQLREGKYALLGYTKPSMTNSNWNKKAINVAFGHALSKNEDYMYAICSFLSTERLPE